MKNLILSLLLIPFLTLAQERGQKQAVRSGGSFPGYTPRSSTPAPTPRSGPDRVSSEWGQKSQIRENAQHKPGSNIPRGGGSVYYYDPYPYYGGGWGWGGGWIPDWRWHRWGAPYYYDNWYPWSYYDRWGYRQPARVYITEGGKTDTVRGIKPHVSLGVQGNKDQLGGFFTIGRKAFFIAEYQRFVATDKSTYYSDLTKDVVIPWNDKRLSNISKGGTLFLGAGHRFGANGVYAALGLGTETVRQQYFDELYILANNGRYSISDYKQNFLTAKLGYMRDFKFATLKLDYEPSRQRVGVGVGVNF